MLDAVRFVERLKTLVAIPSHESSRQIAEYVHGELAAMGLQAEVLPDYDCSVLARLPGVASSGEVLLYCHLDTGHPQGEAKTLVPREREGGRIHGLGISDDKASVSLLLEICDALSRASVRRPVLALFSGKEEGVSSERNPVRRMLDNGLLDPACGVILEPTSEERGFLGVCIGCYGLYRINLDFVGQQGHSALPHDAINPIPAAAWFVTDFVERFGHSGFETCLRVGDVDTKARLQATITQISAMEGLGTIPGNCLVSCEFRIPPGDPVEADFRNRIRLELDAAKMEIGERFPLLRVRESVKADYSGYLSPDPPLLGELCIVEDGVGDLKRELMVAPGRCDANVLEARGVPCIVVGPGLLRQCHRRDEYLAKEVAVRSSEVILENILRFVT